MSDLNVDDFYKDAALTLDLAVSVKSELSRNINRIRRALKEGSSIGLRNIMAELMSVMAEN